MSDHQKRPFHRMEYLYVTVNPFPFLWNINHPIGLKVIIVCGSLEVIQGQVDILSSLILTETSACLWLFLLLSRGKKKILLLYIGGVLKAQLHILLNK